MPARVGPMQRKPTARTGPPGLLGPHPQTRLAQVRAHHHDDYYDVRAQVVARLVLPGSLACPRHPATHTHSHTHIHVSLYSHIDIQPNTHTSYHAACTGTTYSTGGVACASWTDATQVDCDDGSAWTAGTASTDSSCTGPFSRSSFYK